MARKSESPQKTAMREMMRDYLKNNDISIKSGMDVNSVMRNMMSVLLEGVLDEELDEELGYSKYNYLNKDTDIPKRPCIPVTEIWRLPFPVTITVSTNHSSSKSIRTL